MVPTHHRAQIQAEVTVNKQRIKWSVKLNDYLVSHSMKEVSGGAVMVNCFKYLTFTSERMVREGLSAEVVLGWMWRMQRS